VSVYTHCRPDWMLRIAKVLEIPFALDLKASTPSPDGGAGWMTATSAPHSSVKLRVGIASDYPDLFEICAACADARAREQRGSFQIDIDKPGSREKAYGKFPANCSKYHILMIDDPWNPKFDPRLLDLRQFPLEEFQDIKLLNDLFFQPLLEICKFPRNSGKRCGPDGGNSQRGWPSSSQDADSPIFPHSSGSSESE
jgi:hypothetical protein